MLTVKEIIEQYLIDNDCDGLECFLCRCEKGSIVIDECKNVSGCKVFSYLPQERKNMNDES